MIARRTDHRVTESTEGFCSVLSVTLWCTAIVFSAVRADQADGTRSAPATHKTESEPATAPFDTLATKHILVQIKINGKGPYQVIFDTGAPVSLLNTRTAKAAGVTASDRGAAGLGLFGPTSTSIIKKLELGTLHAEGVPVIVMDHPTVEAVSKFLGPVEGILGFPFFARYKMTLDYQAKRLTFVPVDYPPADVIQALVATLMARDRPMRTTLASAALWGLEIDKKPGELEAGVTIERVLADSPAAHAGLHSGDRLLTLDDRWTDSVADCLSAAAFVKPGTQVVLLVRRAGKELELKVKPVTGL